jgi:predicted nucleotidyltransferase
VQYEDATRALARALPELRAVYLFGSRARGDTHGESDIDLAVLTPRPLDPVERFELQERVAGLLHASVDLVDLRAASTVMRVQVLRDSVVLFDADPAERERFEASALGAYARLNDERRAILQDVEERGRVHG